MNKYIVRDLNGDINIEKSLQNFNDFLLIIKKSEISSSEISDAIHLVLNSFPEQIIPKNSLITKVCSYLDFDPKDHNSIVNKINVVIENEVKNNTIRIKRGKSGGCFK
jgi:hypothetical protein